MKIITYYLTLLVLLALLAGYLLQSHPSGMGMTQMVSVSVLLGLYVIAISFIGEGKATDERESMHRYNANRSGLVAGTIIISIGILYQIFTHHIDPWLLASLVGINFIKVTSLIYAHYKN